MLIKRYRVKQPSEANEQMQQELGPQAILLTCTPSPDGTHQIATVGIDEEDFVQFKGKGAAFPSDEEPEKRVGRDERLSTASKALENLVQKSIEFNNKAPDSKGKLSSFFMSRGLDKEIADKIDTAMWQKLPGIDMTSAVPQRENFLNALKELLLHYFPAEGKIGGGHKTPHVIAFVGAQGAGARFAIAQLAIKTKKERMGEVAYISFEDTTLLNSLQKKGIDSHFVEGRGQFLEALKKYYRHQALFIDLPSINPYCVQEVRNLESLLKGIPHFELHLVLNATMKSEDQLRTISTCRSLNPSTIVLTMIGQTKTPGSIANALVNNNLPLSMWTNSTEITGNIVVADPLHLVYHLLFEKEFVMENMPF